MVRGQSGETSDCMSERIGLQYRYVVLSHPPSICPALLIRRATLVMLPGLSDERSVGVLLVAGHRQACRTPAAVIAHPTAAPASLMPKALLSMPPSVLSASVSGLIGALAAVRNPFA